jgi:hypothetical protein
MMALRSLCIELSDLTNLAAVCDAAPERCVLWIGGTTRPNEHDQLRDNDGRLGCASGEHKAKRHGIETFMM